MRFSFVCLVLGLSAWCAAAEDGGRNAGFAFTRLEFDCRGWDDGFRDDRKSGSADRNLIERVAELPEEVRLPLTEPASLTAGGLADLDADDQPPFLFVTGEREGRFSDLQIAVLRAYLDGGGTLIVDAGSRAFGEWFLGEIPRITGLPPVAIAADDPLFLVPFKVPADGISLFQHAGERVIGVKRRGRWVLLFHPGDVNDTLKDNAARLRESLRTPAFHFMVNAMHHAVAHRRGTAVPGAGTEPGSDPPSDRNEALFLTPEEEAERAAKAGEGGPRVEVEVEPPSLLDGDEERGAETGGRTEDP